MKVYELLKVPSPENRLMLLQLGMNETARSVAIEALSNTENYPKIVECLAKANDRLGGFCNPRVDVPYRHYCRKRCRIQIGIY